MTDKKKPKNVKSGIVQQLVAHFHTDIQEIVSIVKARIQEYSRCIQVENNNCEKRLEAGIGK